MSDLRRIDGAEVWITYEFGRLGPGDVELEVGVLFPVAEEEGELCEEAVVRVAHGCESLGAGVSVEPALLSFAGADELLPGLEVVGIGLLEGGAESVSKNVQHLERWCERVDDTYDLRLDLLDLDILLARGAIVIKVGHGREMVLAGQR